MTKYEYLTCPLHATEWDHAGIIETENLTDAVESLTGCADHQFLLCDYDQYARGEVIEGNVYYEIIDKHGNEETVEGVIYN